MSEIVSKFRKWFGAYDSVTDYAPESYESKADISTCGDAYKLPAMGNLHLRGNADAITKDLGFVPFLVDSVGNTEGGGEYSEKVFVLVKDGHDGEFVGYGNKNPEEKLKLIEKYSIGVVYITGNYQSYNGTEWDEIHEGKAYIEPVIKYN